MGASIDHTCNQASGGRTEGRLLGLVLEFKLVGFFNSSAVVMPGETIHPANFPGMPAEETVAPTGSLEIGFSSSVFSSATVGTKKY